MDKICFLACGNKNFIPDFKDLHLNLKKLILEGYNKFFLYQTNYFTIFCLLILSTLSKSYNINTYLFSCNLELKCNNKIIDLDINHNSPTVTYSNLPKKYRQNFLNDIIGASDAFCYVVNVKNNNFFDEFIDIATLNNLRIIPLTLKSNLDI